MATPFAGTQFKVQGGMSFPSLKPIKPATPHGHSLITNLLSDIKDTAFGLPGGMILLGNAAGQALQGNLGPAENIGKGFVNSYKQEYGPLAHLQFGKEWAQIHAHPLQPILDLASIATAGGSVVAGSAKAAGSLGKLGEAAGLVDAETAARLAARATKFREARAVPVNAIPGAPTGYHFYNPNPAIAARQKFVSGLNDILSRTPAVKKLYQDSLPKAGGLRDNAIANNNVMDVIRQNRYLDRKRAEHAGGQRTMINREMAAAAGLFENPNFTVHDAAQLLYPHIHETAKQFSETISEQALKANKNRLAPGWTFLHSKNTIDFAPMSKNPADFRKWLDAVGNRLKAKKISDAAYSVDASGAKHYHIIRKQTVEDMKRQGGDSFQALHLLYKAPTRVWKWATLAASPRYFVNNVVGNGVMLAMSHNPVATARSFYNMVHIMKGEHAAMKSADSVQQAVARITGSHNYYKKWYTGATQGFAHDVTKDLSTQDRFGKAAPVAKLLTQGLYGVTHEYSDTIPRQMAIDSEIRRTTRYQTLLKQIKQDNPGIKNVDAHAQAAERASADPATRAGVIQRVNNIMGDYHFYNRTENAIKQIIPFYSWDRHIMRHTKSMVSERPLEADLLAGLGKQGTAETEKTLGAIPDFLKTYVPLSELGIKGDPLKFLGPLDPIGSQQGGRVKAVNTTGVNPYSSVPDVLNFVASLGSKQPNGGETLSSQLNPLITNAIQHYTGVSILSGKKVTPHGGVLTDVVRNTAASTPLARIIETAVAGKQAPRLTASGKAKNPTLYAGTTREAVDNIMGLPIKNVSQTEAHNLAATESGIKLTKPPAVSLAALGIHHHGSTGPRAPHLAKPRPKTLRKPSLRGTTYRQRKRARNFFPLPKPHTFKIKGI